MIAPYKEKQMEIVNLVLGLFLYIIGFMMLTHVELKPIPCGIIIIISAIVMFVNGAININKRMK